MSKLRVGNTVLWRGNFGTAEPIEAKVKYIQKNFENGSKDGKQVSSIDWDKVTERNVIVDLDNGHWAWASQITEKKS